MRSTPSSRDLAIPGGFVATIARFRFNKGELIMKKALDFL